MVIYPNKHIMEVNIALLTVTDTRTIENDKSGGILVKKIAQQNAASQLINNLNIN